MILLVDLGVTNEGPEFHRYYSEPIVVLSENDLPRTTESPVLQRGDEYSGFLATLWSNLSTEIAHVSRG